MIDGFSLGRMFYHYEYGCSYKNCDVVVSGTQFYRPTVFEPLMNEDLPSGWMAISDKIGLPRQLICPKHKVEITDG